jgi:hypothetical protein
MPNIENHTRNIPNTTTNAGIVTASAALYTSIDYVKKTLIVFSLTFCFPMTPNVFV